MKKIENKRTFYFRTNQNLGAHIQRRSLEWGLTMNGFLNKLVGQDYEEFIRKNTSFVERVNQRLE